MKRRSADAVVTLLLYMPAKYRLKYLTGDQDRKKFGMEALKLMAAKAEAMKNKK